MSDAAPATEMPVPPGVWTRRRRVIYATLLYCAVLVPGLTIGFPESPFVSQVVMALIALAVTVILGYTGLATLDDYNARKATR